MQRLFLVSIAVMAPFLLFELGLRIFGYNQFRDLQSGRELILREAADRTQIYELTPGARGRAWGSDVSINSLGFRGREFTREKPAGTFRIVVLGDSITFGNHLALEDTYPDQLEKLMQAETPATEVLNLGVGGYNTAQEVAFLAGVGVSLDPDVVILGFCLNDLGDVSTNLEYIKRARTYGRSLVYRSRVAQWIRVRLDDIAAVRRAQDFDATEPGRDELGPVTDGLQRELAERLAESSDPPQFLDWFASPARIARLRSELTKLRALSREHGFAVVAIVVPYLEDDPLYQYAYRLLGHEFTRQGFATVDVYEDFRAGGFEDLQRGEKGDSVHPNRAGHEILARRLKAHLDAQ